MFSNKRWFDQNLGRIGFILFSCGAVLLALGIINVAIETVAGIDLSNQTSLGWLQRLLLVGRLYYGLGSTLSWIGALFYCLGRLLESGFVTIIGFERTPPSKLLVKGPDENHVVWIGNPYDSALDAELAAQALAKRLGTANSN